MRTVLKGFFRKNGKENPEVGDARGKRSSLKTLARQPIVFKAGLWN